jgi:hypothetical protein
MGIDNDGLKTVQLQRALYTNREFMQTLCEDICAPPIYERYGEYTERLDSGLYLIGWRIQVAPADYKTGERQYITCDEMTPYVFTGGAVGIDHIMWRSAAAWARRVHWMYMKEKPSTISSTGIKRDFIAFYEEYLLP